MLLWLEAEVEESGSERRSFPIPFSLPSLFFLSFPCVYASNVIKVGDVCRQGGKMVDLFNSPSSSPFFSFSPPPLRPPLFLPLRTSRAEEPPGKKRTRSASEMSSWNGFLVHLPSFSKAKKMTLLYPALTSTVPCFSAASESVLFFSFFFFLSPFSFPYFG